MTAARRLDREVAVRPNQQWSMDFVSDALFDRRRIRALTLVDNPPSFANDRAVGLGPVTLEVIGSTLASMPSPVIGIEHICLGVTGRHAAADQLRARGVFFLVEPRELRPGVHYAFVQAPEGSRMELIDRGTGQT